MTGDIQTTFFSTLVDEWIRCGVRDVVLAPGNRSSLMAAIVGSDPRLRVHVMVDERSASFFALGIGVATGRPAVFWCTSGTAAAEAHAAVIEADLAKVPLLVCTADRPPELRHVRDWQSIDQSRLYGDSTRWSYDPGVADEAMKSSWRSIGARAFLETVQHPTGPGPVHLNLPIREPWELELGSMPEGRTDDKPWHWTSPAFALTSPAIINEIVGGGRKGVIIVGRSDVDPDVLHGAATKLGWPVIAEARSGCRVPGPTTIASAHDLLRAPKFAKSHLPDVVLRVGNPVVSKSVATWLTEANAEEWALDPYDSWEGPAAQVSRTLRTEPAAFFRGLMRADVATAPKSWLDEWRAADDVAQTAIASVLSNGTSDGAIARSLLAGLPDDANLFAATSMPVRAVEWHSAPRPGVRVLANRGASGMDGVTSTAAGVAVATDKPTVLLVGDLTFLHDLNALWATNGAAAPVNLTIVVIDNNGGGIFSLFPTLTGLGEDHFERYVATPQAVDIPAVASALGATVTEVKALDELMPAVTKAIVNGGLQVVHVWSDRTKVTSTLDDIRSAVAAAISA